MIAIIPARGGSKRLPGKNIKELNGKPLIAYSIEAALKANHISRVIVSTDSEKIREVALKWGAEVDMRPKELSTDESPSQDTFDYLADKFNLKEYIVLQPTSPERTAELIDNAIRFFYTMDAYAVVSHTDGKVNGAIYIYGQGSGRYVFLTKPMVDIDTQDDFDRAAKLIYNDT